MFEFIGIVVVVCIVWVVLKGIFKGATKGVMLRACDYAISLNVPQDFAFEAVKNPNAIKTARLALAENQGNTFKSLDVYQQYGQAIALLYESTLQSSNGNTPDSVKSQLKSFFKPQIEQLEAEGTGVFINHITYVYVGALTTCITKKPISLEEIKLIIKQLFPSEEHNFAIDNGYNIICHSSDFLEKCSDILPVVNDELENGKGEFFVKYTRKAKKEIDSMFEPQDDYDPRNVSRTSFLDV